MALEQFRPEVWARRLIIDTEKALVFRNVVNTDYQGEIANAGDVVRINEIGDVTISTYTEDSTLSYQTMSAGQKELHIDQAKSFSVLVDDVAKAQSNVDIMSAVMQKASFGMADTIDQYIASLHTGFGVAIADLGDTSTGLDIYAIGDGSDQLIAVFANMNRYLDESNAPSMGRWVVMPAWMHSYLTFAQLIDNTTLGAIKGGETTSKGNGFVGQFMGFDLYASNNVARVGTDYAVMFGTPDAISYAGQVTKVETGRHSDYMADYIRGLYVYGAKVVRPDHLGRAIVAPAGLST